MTLGNLTSQFFANLYLNDFDYFVKYNLKAKHYIRYVDDFVILHNSKEMLESYKDKIHKYLSNLKLELHPSKSKIIPFYKGVNLLGFKVFYYHKLLRKSNKRKFEINFNKKLDLRKNGKISYEDLLQSLQGWFGYAMWANTYKLKQNIIKIIKNSFKENQFKQLTF